MEQHRKSVGTQRVLLALADTCPPRPVDLTSDHPGRTGDAWSAAPRGAAHDDTVRADSAPPETAGRGSAHGATVPASGSTPADAEGFVPSAENGRYLPRGLLGSGGMGEVMEVFDQDLRRTVALKRLKAGAGERLLAHLIQEAQITAQLEHPNIPSVHALGIDEAGRTFFTMTRLRGQTLQELLDRRREDPQARAEITTGRLLRILLQVSYAVAFAHSRGVMHRDLKPDNIIIGQFGEVRVMDWGLAKVAGAPQEPDGAEPGPPLETSVDRPETCAGTFAGTPGYASPEQAQGRTDLDPRADVYALGAILYAMLAGRPPVVADGVLATIEATVEGDVPPLQDLARIPDRLAAVAHRALAVAREDRYPDVWALLEDLEAYLEDRPVTALEENVLTRAGKMYMGRSERLARFRNVDIDMLSGSSTLFGVALGIGFSLWGVPWLTGIAWLCLAAACVMLLPPLYTYLRKPRPDDPCIAGTVDLDHDSVRASVTSSRRTRDDRE